jgi:hypothetical protein
MNKHKFIFDYKKNPFLVRNDLDFLRKRYDDSTSGIELSKKLIKIFLNKNHAIKNKDSELVTIGKLSVFYARKITNNNPLYSFGEIQEMLEIYGRKKITDLVDWKLNQKIYHEGTSDTNMIKVFKNKFHSGRNINQDDNIFHGYVTSDGENYNHFIFHEDEINELYSPIDYSSQPFPLFMYKDRNKLK